MSPAPEAPESLSDDQWTISPPTPWVASGLAGLIATVREDRQDRDQGPLAPGIQALAVHRFGQWTQSEDCPRLLRLPAALLERILYGYVRSVLGFEIPRAVRMGRRVKFFHQHGVVIDAACVIGDDCIFHHGVTLSLNARLDSSKNLFQAPQVGSRVVFGAGCIVLGGVRIGDGASIGPNAVVTSDVRPGASVMAPPSRNLHLR